MHAQGHHFAVDRSAHRLALDVVVRRTQALLQLAYLGGSLAQLVGGLALVLQAQLRGAGVDFADALAHRSLRAAVLGQSRLIVGHDPLQPQHARAMHETFARQPIVDRQLFVGELDRLHRGLNLRLERRGLRARLAYLGLQHCRLLVERLAPRREDSAFARGMLGRAHVGG